MSLDEIELQCKGNLRTLEECNAKLEKLLRETDKVVNKLDFRPRVNDGSERVGKDSKQTHNRHSKFYLKDGNVIFSVQGTLFKVHRYFFERDSPIFAAMFSLPPPPVKENGELENLDAPSSPTPKVEGDTDDHPIVLEGVCPRQFELFLSILYPSDFTTPDPCTAGEWTSVLNLATRWDFSSIRKLAIHKLACELGEYSPALKLFTAKHYDIEDWLVPAYSALCVRDDPLDITEGRLLGLEDVIAIENIRHTIHYPSNLNRDSESVAKLVKQTFDICRSLDEHRL